MKVFQFVAAALLVGGAVGFIPTYLQLREAQTQAQTVEQQLTVERDEAQSRLRLSSIHSRLGILLTQVRRSEFEAARQTSTQMFDEVNAALEVTENADDQRRLQTIKQLRDQVTAALALNDPAVLNDLEQSFDLLSASLL